MARLLAYRGTDANPNLPEVMGMSGAILPEILAPCE